MSATSTLLRPLGMLEKLYIARQVLGIYHSVIVTATYTLRSNLDDIVLYSLFCATIPGLLNRHPPLCCYFEGGNTSNPIFRRLESITVKDVFQIVALNENESLAQKLEKLHDQPWPVDIKPLWKLVVMKPPATGHGSTLHVAFVYHHVIGDGLSGLAFHHFILHELTTFDPSRQHLPSPQELFYTPLSMTLLPPVEKLTPFSLSWGFLLKQAAQEYLPHWLIGAPAPLWAGLPVQPLEKCPLVSRVRIIAVPAAELSILQTQSKAHSVTITSLLTATILTTLTHALPSADSFVGMMPYTLRRVTGTTPDEMVNQSSGMHTNYHKCLLDEIRNAANRTESLWSVAKYFHKQLQEELVKCPRDNLTGLLPYVLDQVTFYQKKFGREREVSFELSNVGIFTPKPPTVVEKGEAESTPQGWRLDGIALTQGAQPAGSALTINCASVFGGPLSIAITWQDAVVGEEIIDALARGFGDMLRLLSV